MLEVEKSVPDHIREHMEPLLEKAGEKTDSKVAGIPAEDLAAAGTAGTGKDRLETEA